MAECIALSRSSSGGYSVYRFDNTRQDFLFDINRDTGKPEIWFPDGHTFEDLVMLSVMAIDPSGNFGNCCYYGVDESVFMADQNTQTWGIYLFPGQVPRSAPYITLLPNVAPNGECTRVILVMKE